jgi:putative radical SAM enzyme (TIGR03279 family)
LPAKGGKGVIVEEVEPGSPAERAGIQRGDALLSIDGYRVSDTIDYMFLRGGESFDAVVSRGGKKRKVGLELREGEDPGLLLGRFRIKTCGNNCLFCFVAQLPRGLRKSLYLRDEDYRMSFLYGNYVTLSNLTAQDKKRIVGQRLSPLYVSVHSTDRALRNRMLGNPRAPDIMKELRFLSGNRIRMHTQIVLCPGLNDGDALRRTISDLYSFYPYVESVAVVPVGLTAHRKKELRPVEKDDALAALEIIEAFQRRLRKKHGDPLVYGADELYIKAGRAFPPLGEYGELPQIENGVGMVPLFLSRARRLRPPAPESRPRYLTFTGESFYPYFAKFIERLVKNGFDIKAVPVENTFFGNSVTVAGLLTGRDVIRALAPEARGRDVLLVPDVALREGHDVFLDDVRPGDLEKALGIKTETVESTPEGLIRRLKGK